MSETLTIERYKFTDPNEESCEPVCAVRDANADDDGLYCMKCGHPTTFKDYAYGGGS